MMAMKTTTISIVVAVLIALPANAAQPASQPERITAPASQPEVEQPDWFVRSRNPVSWVKWGADQRSRWEYMNNAHTLNGDQPNHERDYFRFRTRLWSTFSLMDIEQKQPADKFGIDINTRLAWEWRTYLTPSDNINGSNNLPFNHQDMDEVIFDNLNVKLRNLFNQPMTVTVGRQDIRFGDGWLINEGTPQDGSRTVFFDAARVTYDFKSIKTVADLIYLNDHADSDWMIEPFNAREQPLNNQDEQGAIFYVSNSSVKNTTIDGYFLYKHDELASGTDSKNPVLKPLKKGDAGDIYTFGSRVEHTFDQHWRARGELAGQFGEKDARTLSAFGFNSRLFYYFRDPQANQLRFTYEFLSGDDPSTRRNEGFDILWGRWTQWSDIMSKAIQLETGRGDQYTNMHRLGPGWTFKPTAKSEFSLDYYLLFADENPLAGTTGFSRNGRFRGQLPVAIYRYIFNEHVSTHIAAELFAPGDYYSNFRNDVATYLRADVTFSW